MRITGGRFRGKILSGGESIRSSKAVVRAAIFNIIYSRFGEFIEGARVADLYCGAGILAVEAVSRGAKEVIINDIQKTSLKLAYKNLSALKAEFMIRQFSQPAIGLSLDYSKIDLVFLDPPFVEHVQIIAILKQIKKYERENENPIVVVCETGKDGASAVAEFCGEKIYRYGKSFLVVTSFL